MNGVKKSIWTALLAVLVGGVVLAGCLGGNDKLKLVQTGSSTVLPLAVAWAAEYDDADITVSGGGSSHGLNALLNKEADLGDASRLMKGSDYTSVGGDPSLVTSDGEATGAAPNGVWPYKWVVAYDVLTVVINNNNDYADKLNYTQLYRIFTDDDPAVYWDEVPGLEATAPHQKIEIYAPDEASGTYDYFFEEIIPNWGKDTQVADTRLNAGDGVYHPSADDNVILSAVEENEFAIGYFGFAYYIENTNKIKVVSIAEGGVNYEIPSLANVANYPLARPLHIYTNGIPEPGDARNDYLRYVLSDGQEIVPEVGYVRLSLVDNDLITSQLGKLGA
ncbi:MAG: PstS family phosphate ABC transporter substrate-binding protein [Candidatus Thermoplasmatota archaeon]|nr:PstS family phosphate ABC transporter substrate-binding protein [Candidatus Thermoplasmatota archaeon]